MTKDTCARGRRVGGPSRARGQDTPRWSRPSRSRPMAAVLATGSHDTTVRLWDAAAASELAVLRGDAGQVYALAFSPDSATLAVGTSDGAVKFWNLRAQREVATLKAHDSIVSSLAFSPDGRTLATISVDETMRLWKAPAFSYTDR